VIPPAPLDGLTGAEVGELAAEVDGAGVLMVGVAGRRSAPYAGRGPIDAIGGGVAAIAAAGAIGAANTVGDVAAGGMAVADSMVAPVWAPSTAKKPPDVGATAVDSVPVGVENSGG